jgi:protein-S-isoprenylcysteine O-methyltransferase Ste14
MRVGHRTTNLRSCSISRERVDENHNGNGSAIHVEQGHATNLVQEGVFSRSRNPIFLGMMVTLVGLFFVIPNALTLVALVMGVVLIQIQVRLEEEFLAKSHGNEYSEYRRRVRRWF